MADLVVDGGAYRFGVGRVAGRAVIQWGRDGLLNIHHVVVTDSVNGFRGHSRANLRCEMVEHLRGKPASDPHALDILS